MELSRRSLLKGFALGAGGLLLPVAPAIVRASSLMPIAPLETFLQKDVAYAHLLTPGDEIHTRALWNRKTKTWCNLELFHEQGHRLNAFGERCWSMRHAQISQGSRVFQTSDWELKTLWTPGVMLGLESDRAYVTAVRFGNKGSMEFVTAAERPKGYR